MSARPTSADVLRIIGNDDELRDAARVAAVLARESWLPDAAAPNAAPPNGWIGGQVRNVLPAWLDDALGTGDDADVTGDPTGEIGAALYPSYFGTVVDRATLDALPVGSLIVDRDGYVLVKETWTRAAGDAYGDGWPMTGTEYRVLHSPDSPERGAVFAADEIAGEYRDFDHEPMLPAAGVDGVPADECGECGERHGSTFLPGRAYVFGTLADAVTTGRSR